MKIYTKPYPKLLVGNTPSFLLGVNYWSRAGGPRMWERFDETAVDHELAQMQRIGLNACRSFNFLPSVMPRRGQCSETALGYLRRFLSSCERHGISAIPSFLVGHMSGENYDFVGQEGRCPYTDPQILHWQNEIVRQTATVCKTSPSVIAYLASNEMPLWGGKSTPVQIRTWAETLRATLHDVDASKPFSLGDGVMNLKGGQNGFDVETLRGIIDFVGPHTYYADHDPLRQALNAEFCIRNLTYLGVPVLFEEFGCSSNQASESNQRHYYREVIHSCLSAGATGALGWCFSDFSLDDDPPYTHHAFELSFGITATDGREKTVCDELRAIAALSRNALDFPTLEAPVARAAIVVPSYFNTQYPFAWEDRDRMRRTLLQSYVLTTLAGIEAELVPETHPLDGYELILVPSTQKLLTKTWRALATHAQRGATVYWSYFGGDYNFHQGMWCSNFSELTGCEHQLRYACFDDPEALLRLDGDGFSIQVQTTNGSRYGRAYLPICSRSSNVAILAQNTHHQPAIVEHRLGKGRVLFSAYPLEFYLAEHPRNRDELSGVVALYELLAKRAEINSPIGCNTPFVQRRLARDAKGPLLWLINHDWNSHEVTIDSPQGAALYGTTKPLIDGNQRITMAEKQVFVFRL